MTRIIKAQDASPQAGVLKLTDLAAEAQSAILEARQDAARIVAQAHTKADEVMAQARQKGYEEGYSLGREEGLVQGKLQAKQEAGRTLAAELQTQAELARRIVQELSAARDSLLEQARADVVDFAIELAGKVAVQVSRQNIAPAKAALEKVLLLAQGQAQVTIRVNPAQLTALQAYGRHLLDAASPGLSVEWIGDPAIEPGGVKLFTGRGLIDATIRTQMQNIAAALTDQQAPEGAAETI